MLALVRDAKTPDELAFAVGAFSHYVGDIRGHSVAVNPSVGMEFPKLEEKFGRVVTYEDDPHAHVRTEFAFDVNEIAKHRFAPSRYLSHVGLKVSMGLLKEAFEETYGLKLEDVLKTPKPRSLPNYQFAVRRFLPRIAYAETLLHRHSMPADTPGPDLDQMTRELAQSEQENGWDRYRRRAGIGTYTLAGLIFVLPKVGPLQMLAIKGPTVQTEDLYVKSVNLSIDLLRAQLAGMRTAWAADHKQLVNRDLDTGARVAAGTYRLTDETYAKLVGELTRDPGVKVPSGLRDDVLEYYSDPNAPISTKKKPEQWAKLQTELAMLKQMPTIAGR